MLKEGAVAGTSALVIGLSAVGLFGAEQSEVAVTIARCVDEHYLGKAWQQTAGTFGLLVIIGFL